MTCFHPRAKAALWAGFAGSGLVPLLARVPPSPVFLVAALAVVGLAALHAVVLREDGRERAAEEEGDVLSLSGALQFPLYAGCALVCLYLVFQSVEGDLLVRLFRAQFVLVAHSLLVAFAEPRTTHWAARLPARPLPFGLTAHRLALHALVGALCLAYFLTVHWALNNLLGGLLAIASTASLRVSRPHVLLLLHTLLFFYDVFFVFGTEVMVGVAQWLDAPIKLKLPNAGRFSALGLGDLVVPGLLAALAAKFDVDRALRGRPGPEPPVPMLTAAMGGYALGMLATMVAMHLSATAQPALLYLIPAMWATVLATAWSRGELRAFFAYHAEPLAPLKAKTA